MSDVKKTYLEKQAVKEAQKPVLLSNMLRPTRATDDYKPAKGNVYGGSAALRNVGGKGRKKYSSPTRKG